MPFKYDYSNFSFDDFKSQVANQKSEILSQAKNNKLANLAAKSGIANEDVFRAGMDQTYAALNLLNTGNEDLISKTMRPNGKGSIFGDDIPLNLQVERATDNEFGYFGRPLSDVRGVGGKSIYETFNTPEQDTSYNSRYADKPITGEFKPALLKRITDMDSMTFQGVTDQQGKPTEDRIAGVDAYEVFHDDAQSKKYFESAQGQAKLDRQKEHLANFGIIPKQQEQLQAIDTGLDALRNRLKERESSNNYSAVNKQGYVGAYQFGIARLKDLGLVDKNAPDNNSALNNPNVWTGKYGIKSKEDFLSSEDVQDTVATEHLNNLAVMLSGNATDEKDLYGKIAAAHLLGVQGSKDLSKTDANKTSGQEYYDLGSSVIGTQPTSSKETVSTVQKEPTLTAESFRGVDQDSMLGEALDIAQSSLLQQYGKTAKAVNKAAVAIGESLGINKDTMEGIFHDDSMFGGKFTEYAKQEVSDKITGVMAKTREEQKAGMDKALESIKTGNYADAAWESLKILPYMLGDSAGEMASIFAGVPGITAAVAARVSEDAETYKKNNDKDPSAHWMIGSVLTNAAALFGEKFLIKSGVGDIIEKGLSKAKRVGGVAASTVGEAVQEYYDQTQQEYMTQKTGEKTLAEIATSPEAQLAAVAGGVMGGALRGAGEIGGAAIDTGKPLSEKLNAEIERRKAAKAAKETEAVVGESVKLSTTYGGVEAVATRETEHKDSIDKAIESGDIRGAVEILKAYKNDLSNDSEKLMNNEEFEQRLATVKNMVNKTYNAINESKADKSSVDTFGSSPDLIDTAMSDISVDEAETFLRNYKKAAAQFGSDPVGTTRIEQHINAKKTLAMVETDVATDIKAKAEAVQNAATPSEKETAVVEFERFKQDRIDTSNKLNNWLKSIEQEIMSEAETMVQNKEAKNTTNAVRKIVAEEQAKRKANKQKVEYKGQTYYNPYETKNVLKKKTDGVWVYDTTYASKETIARRVMSNLMGKDPEIVGIYTLQNAKDTELQAFNAAAALAGIDTKADIAKAKEAKAKVEKSITEQKKATPKKSEQVSDMEAEKIAYEETKTTPKSIEEVTVVEKPAKLEKLRAEVKRRKEAKAVKETEKAAMIVTDSIIKKSKLASAMQNPLVAKSTTSRLANDSEAGVQLSELLSTLSDKLDIDNIEKIIADKFTLNVSNTIERYRAVENDPARVLFSEEGTLDSNAVAAISKALIEYLLKYGNNILLQDRNQVAQMLGYGDNVELVPAEAFSKLGDKVFKKNVADVLAKSIMKDLGIKIRAGVDEDLIKVYGDVFSKAIKAGHAHQMPNRFEEKFIASLGQMAAIIGGEIGIFTKLDADDRPVLTQEEYARIAAGDIEVTNPELKMDLIGIGPLGKSLVRNKDMYDTFNKAAKEFTEGTYVKEVRTEPISSKKVTHRVIADVYNVKQQSIDVINKERSKPWRLDTEAIDTFEGMKDTMKFYMGYMTDKQMEELSYVDYENQTAKNNAITLKLDLLNNLVNRLGEDNVDADLFYEWFYGSNGRYYLDNNEVNPQNDTFNRFIVGLKSNRVTVDLSKEDANSTKTFYIALAQSFGKDIDKMSIEDSIKAGKELFDMGSKELTNLINDTENFEPEAIGHTIQGLLAVKAAEKAKGKAFDTNLVIETDAVTSGIILKLLQLPLVQDVKNLLKRGGIIFEDQPEYSTFTGTNKLIADGQLDLYRMLAQSYGKAITSHLDSNVWKVDTNNLDDTSLKRALATNSRREAVLKASRDGIMPIFETEGDKIKGKLRSIFKPVVMVFGYGGGIGSIKRKFIGEIVEELPTKLVKELYKYQDDMRKGKVDKSYNMPILNFFKALDKKHANTTFNITNVRQADALIKSLLNKDILNTKVYGKQTLRSIAMSDMTALYGDTLSKALEDIFGSDLINANTTINNAFRMMFRIFNHNYNQKLKEFAEKTGHEANAEEKATIILDMKKEFPAVAPPFAKNDEKGIIIDQKTSPDTSITAQTLGSYKRKGTKDSMSIAAVVKEFEEAISAGNVVPIHYIDAAIMGQTLLNVDGITQVFDAIVANLDNATEANLEYNSQVIEVSKNYSLTEKVLESLDSAISTLDAKTRALFNDETATNEYVITGRSEEDASITLDAVVEAVNTLHTTATAKRKELFSQNIKSDHMTGLGAVVEIDRNGNVVESKKAETAKEESKTEVAKANEEPQGKNDNIPAISVAEPTIAELALIERDLKQAYKNLRQFKSNKKKEQTIKPVKNLKGKALEVSEAAEPTIGGSEEEAKARIAKIFKKELDADAMYKNLSDEEIKELEEMFEVDSKYNNGIVPENKQTKKAKENALKKECKR